MSTRPSQRDWTEPEFDALPLLLSVPTVASLLHTGPKTLRARFNGGRTAVIEVGDQEVVLCGVKLGRQLHITKESVRPAFRARGP